MSNNVNIGFNIANKRKQFALTQADLAKKLNVSKQTISYWERGEKTPRMGMIEKMANIFKCSVSEIIDGESGSLFASIFKQSDAPFNFEERMQFNSFNQLKVIKKALEQNNIDNDLIANYIYSFLDFQILLLQSNDEKNLFFFNEYVSFIMSVMKGDFFKDGNNIINDVTANAKYINLSNEYKNKLDDFFIDRFKKFYD